VSLAYRVSEVLFALLRGAPELDLHSRRVIQAAAMWFLSDGDGDRDDMRTVHGLDDDLEVVNYACRVLDRQDLVIDTGPARLLVV